MQKISCVAYATIKLSLRNDILFNKLVEAVQAQSCITVQRTPPTKTQTTVRLVRKPMNKGKVRIPDSSAIAPVTAPTTAEINRITTKTSASPNPAKPIVSLRLLRIFKTTRPSSQPTLQDNRDTHPKYFITDPEGCHDALLLYPDNYRGDLFYSYHPVKIIPTIQFPQLHKSLGYVSHFSGQLSSIRQTNGNPGSFAGFQNIPEALGDGH